MGSFQIVRKSSTFPPPYTYPSPNGWTRALNYRTEPLSYRYHNADWLQNTSTEVPGGISRALTDELVMADPQTPVFAAGKGTPVRMRMFHPAGSNEQVITLHGHFWQEEPYINNSTQIGHNPLSQAFGARDAFGANASFDMVLDHAGGVFSVTGDYLFRTFIGNDFMFGMWGLMRVGEDGKDIVRITRFEEVESTDSEKRIIVAGVNTVNTDSGEMAKEVELFAGVDPSKTKLGTAEVDPSTGTWVTEFSVPNVPQEITVVSPVRSKPARGGGVDVSGQIAKAKAPAGAEGGTEIQRLFEGYGIEGDSFVDAFRNPTAQDQSPSDASFKTAVPENPRKSDEAPPKIPKDPQK